MTLENSGEVIVLLAKALNPFSISPIICCHNATGSLPLSAIGVLLVCPRASKTPSLPPYHTVATGRSTSPRVVRRQHSHPFSAGTFANVGVKGPLANLLMLVELWI